MDKAQRQAARQQKEKEYNLLIHARLRAAFDEFIKRKKAQSALGDLPEGWPKSKVKFTRDYWYDVLEEWFLKHGYPLTRTAIMDHLNDKSDTEIKYPALAYYSEWFGVSFNYLLTGEKFPTKVNYEDSYGEQMKFLQNYLLEVQKNANDTLGILTEIGQRMNFDSLIDEQNPFNEPPDMIVENYYAQRYLNIYGPKIDELKEENKRLRAQLEKEEKTK